MGEACEYSPLKQAKIFLAFCAIYNFSRIHDGANDEVPFDSEDLDLEPGNNQNDIYGQLAGQVDNAEKTRAEARRDRIAQAMWESYQEELQRRETDL